MFAIPSKQEGDPQDNFLESRNPTELVMCILLAAAYAGLAKQCWEPLLNTSNWRLFINIEGLLVTISLLSMLVGLRPYLNPSSLQLSNKGLKYQGPYWPSRKTINWERIFKLYVCPELIVVLYYSKNNRKQVWPLFIQSIYFADKENIEGSIRKFSLVPPIYLSSPGWQTRLLLMCLIAGSAIIILEMFLR